MQDSVAFQGGAVQLGSLEYANPMYHDMAMTLDPPPYTLGRDPATAAGYDQDKKPVKVIGGYDQEEKP